MNEISEVPQSEIASESTPGESPIDTQTESIAEPPQAESIQPRLAGSMKDDPRFQEVRTELVDQWRAANGSEWATNRNGGLDLKQDYMAWQYGDEANARTGQPINSLESRVEKEFRQRFEEDAQQYDEQERVKVYDNPYNDPIIAALDREITKGTNLDADVTKASTSGKGRFGEPFGQVWDRAHSAQTIRAYRRFISSYPEKAVGYATKNEVIRALLDSESKSNAQQSASAEAAETTLPSSGSSVRTNENPQTTATAPIESQLPLSQLEQTKPTEALQPTVDPRDYFRDTAFQKVAQETDQDDNHPWQATNGAGRLLQDESGTIAFAETFDPEEQDEEAQLGLLITEKDASGETSSAYVRNELSNSARLQILDILNDTTPRFKGETRHQFIKTLVDVLPHLKDQSDVVVAETLTSLALKLLPDDQSGPRSVEIPIFSGAQPDQQDQLNRLLQLASTKLPPEEFTEKIQELQNNLQWTDEAFGRNYVHVLTDIRRIVFNSRSDTSIDQEASRRIEPLTYDVKDKITRDFSSKEEMTSFLSTLPVEAMPDVRFMPKSRKQAEIVLLDAVVGGNNIQDWSVSTAGGRGIDKIFEFANALKDGTASVVGNNQPIEVTEIDGKYYLQEGRHRTAALKALGVKEAPMLVTHVKKN